MNGAAIRTPTSRWAWVRLLAGAGILVVLALRLGAEPFLDGIRHTDAHRAPGGARGHGGHDLVLCLALEPAVRAARRRGAGADGVPPLLPLPAAQRDAARRSPRRPAPRHRPRSLGRRHRARAPVGAVGPGLRAGGPGHDGRGRAAAAACGSPVRRRLAAACGRRRRPRCPRRHRRDAGRRTTRDPHRAPHRRRRSRGPAARRARLHARRCRSHDGVRGRRPLGRRHRAAAPAGRTRPGGPRRVLRCRCPSRAGARGKARQHGSSARPGSAALPG